MAIGIFLLAYPIVSDAWNRMQQTRAVAGYVEKTKDLTPEQRAKMLAAAREYNAKLVLEGEGRYSMTKAERQEYLRTLDVTGTGIMGYLSIPKIGVELPIYHTTDEAVLEIAVGHLEGSSLPVGGPGTHAVVSGHTGLPSAMLLTGLDRIKPGDTFSFTVLGVTRTYQVDRISIVDPTDRSGLVIGPGKDQATVLTCTPYGVNNHRRLVRGHRIFPQHEQAVQKAPLSPILIIEWAAMALVPLIALIALIVVLAKRRRGKRAD